MRYKGQLSLMLLTVCCFGCSGGGTEIDLEPVSGVVTMDGQPLANAVVVFVPTEGNPSSDQTDANGYYELSHRGEGKGAILGMHKVSITTGQPPTEEIDPDADMSNVDTVGGVGFEEGQPAAKGKPEKDPIPAKYNTETTLTADVKDGSNTIDFKLESK